MTLPSVVPPKPPGLRLPFLAPKNVRRCPQPSFPHLQEPKNKNSAAKKAGLRYEAKAGKFLNKFFGGVTLGDWWKYTDGGLERRCQTDAVWVSPDKDLVVIFEIKLGHTTDAWWQLRQLYSPVLHAHFGPRVNINVVEVCRSYDPILNFPEPIVFISDPEEFRGWITLMYRPEFTVFRWRE